MQTSMKFTILLQMSMIMMLNISTTYAQALTAYVKVTNWTCINSRSPSCYDYKLKIGYTKMQACTLLPDSITTFAQNENQQMFPLSSRNGTKFTYVPEKTSNEHLIVVVFDETNQFQATSCEDINQRHEHGNKTSIHTDAYFTGSAKYSFDIEIITVCSTILCTGLFCNHCVTTKETTIFPLKSSTSTTTSTNTPKDRTTVTSVSTTTLVTDTNLEDKSNITTTSIVLIAVIVALVLVIMILFYKWWTKENKVSGDGTIIEKETTDNNVPKNSNKEEKNERNDADFSDVDKDEINPN